MDQAQWHRLSVLVERSSLSESTIRRLIKVGQIKTVRVGRARRVTEAELQRFLANEHGETS